jgi:hypothetical protein
MMGAERQQLGQGENSGAALLQGGAGCVGTANGSSSPRTVSSDAGGGVVVQGSSGRGHAWHALKFGRQRQPVQSGKQLRLGDGAVGTEETPAWWRRTRSSSRGGATHAAQRGTAKGEALGGFN